MVRVTLLVANAYNAYMSNKSKGFDRELLSYTTIKDITSTRSQYLSLLVELGFVNRKLDDSCNKNAENRPLIRGIIAEHLSTSGRIQYLIQNTSSPVLGQLRLILMLVKSNFGLKVMGVASCTVFIHPCQFFSMIIIRISFWTRIIRTFFPKSRLMMVP